MLLSLCTQGRTFKKKLGGGVLCPGPIFVEYDFYKKSQLF